MIKNSSFHAFKNAGIFLILGHFLSFPFYVYASILVKVVVQQVCSLFLKTALSFGAH